MNSWRHWRESKLQTLYHRICIEIVSLILIARQDMKARCSLCPFKLDEPRHSVWHWIGYETWGLSEGKIWVQVKLSLYQSHAVRRPTCELFLPCLESLSKQWITLLWLLGPYWQNLSLSTKQICKGVHSLASIVYQKLRAYQAKIDADDEYHGMYLCNEKSYHIWNTYGKFQLFLFSVHLGSVRNTSSGLSLFQFGDKIKNKERYCVLMD